MEAVEVTLITPEALEQRMNAEKEKLADYFGFKDWWTGQRFKVTKSFDLPQSLRGLGQGYNVITVHLDSSVKYVTREFLSTMLYEPDQIFFDKGERGGRYMFPKTLAYIIRLEGNQLQITKQDIGKINRPNAVVSPRIREFSVNGFVLYDDLFALQ